MGKGQGSEEITGKGSFCGVKSHRKTYRYRGVRTHTKFSMCVLRMFFGGIRTRTRTNSTAKNLERLLRRHRPGGKYHPGTKFGKKTNHEEDKSNFTSRTSSVGRQACRSLPMLGRRGNILIRLYCNFAVFYAISRTD